MTRDWAKSPWSGNIFSDTDVHRVHTVRRVLNPELDELLGSHDLDVIADRLRRLKPVERDDLSRVSVDTLMDTRMGRWSSFWKWSARLAAIIATAAGTAIVLLAIVNYAGAAFARWLPWQWIGWPLGSRVLGWMTRLGLLCVFASWLAVYLFAREAVRKARIGLGAASDVRPDTWPGVGLDAPFDAIASRWFYAAFLSIIGGLGFIWWGMGTSSSGWLSLLGVLMVPAGVWLALVAVRYQRVQALVTGSLFAGRA